MSKQIDDGGPAFPHSIDRNAITVQDFTGMSLRDYFAAAALQGIWTNLHCTPTVKFNEIATRAYQQADAMIEARKEGA
jgi:hypothetical protein